MIVGIDPGGKGWVARLDRPNLVLTLAKLPMHRVGKRAEVIAAELAELLQDATIIGIEIPTIHPKMAKTALFTFGVALGGALAVATLRGVGMRRWAPKDWQRVAAPGGTWDKARARAVATEVWPCHATTFSRKDDPADAALIALATWRERDR